MEFSETSYYLEGIQVKSLGRDKLLNNLVAAALSKKIYFAFALHISALRSISNKKYIESFSLPNTTYIDGISILLLLKSKKLFSQLRKYPTTDLGHDLIEQFQSTSQSQCRIALIGGENDLSREAIEILESKHKCKGVFACSGYQNDWSDILEKIRDSQPDIIFIGMGCPIENIWCLENSLALPNCLVVTCGGWFSFIAGREKRAPQLWQAFGFEWLWRLILNPKRLTNRYLVGLLNLIAYLIFKREKIEFFQTNDPE